MYKINRAWPGSNNNMLLLVCLVLKHHSGKLQFMVRECTLWLVCKNARKQETTWIMVKAVCVCVTDHVDVILPRALTAGITSSIDTGPYISDSLQLFNLELPSTWYPVGTTGRRWQWSFTEEMIFLWGQFFWNSDFVYTWYYRGSWSEVGVDLRRRKLKERVGEDFCKLRIVLHLGL